MYQEDINTSKRISFQSIFSSLCTLYQHTTPDDSLVADLETMAHDINARLHKKYPCETMEKTNQPTTQSVGDKQKPRKCPKCGKFTLYHNKGISKAGNPYENEKCKCGYIKWLTDNYYTAEAKAKAQAQDAIDDEANNLPMEDEYGNPI